MVKAKSHLLKHEVPDNVDTAGHFGTDDKKEIARKVAAMGQRQLQDMFRLVYNAATGSNNNNWLRRKLLEAAGCQEAKVVGMGNSSPRKKGVGMGDLGIDGGASYRTENGMRRTKRQRKPRKDADYIGEDAFEGGRHRDGGPLSTGNAYLQQQEALYKANLMQNALNGHDFPFHGLMMGKPFTGQTLLAQPFQEVQWPGPSQRRPDESNSSSEDQTAYEHSHSHHSHQSRELGAGGPGSPTTNLNRQLETTAMLLSRSNVKLPRTAEAQLYLQHSLPGIPGMLGVPGVAVDDSLHSLYSNHSAPARFGGQPNSPSAYMTQMMHQQEGGHNERVGGNTPLLDLDGELLHAPVLGHSSANDSLLGVEGRLPSFDGVMLPSVNTSPILGTDFANIFADHRALDTTRPFLSSQGLDIPDMPAGGRMSSLDFQLGDIAPAMLLNDPRLHMPAAPPPTPVSRGLGSPRYHGGLEGMAAPSLRYTGAHPAHIPANAFAAFTGEPNVAPRLAQAAPGAPPSPQAGPPPGGLTRQHRSMSVEPLDQRMDMPMFQSMMVRTLSTPEPLPAPEAAPESQTTPGPMHTVASLGAWNVNEVPHIEMPVTPPAAPALPKGLPVDTDLAAQASGTPRAQLAGAAERLPGPAAQLPEEPLGLAAPPPEKAPAAPLELASLNAEDAAELLADPPALPTIKEEERSAAQPVAESEAVACPSIKPQLGT